MIPSYLSSQRRWLHAIALGVVLLAAGVMLVIPRETTLGWKGAALSFFAPLYRGVTLVKSEAKDATVDFKSVDDLLQETESLRKQNALLRAENATFRNLREENKRLKAALKFQQQATFELLVAKVIAREPSSWWNYVTIDRGTIDGLRADQAVVTTEGLIGKVAALTPGTAKIVLLGDDNCRVAAALETGNFQGIVMGKPTISGSTQCRMTFIDSYASIQIGDRIYSSGLGGVFPPGILIGRVIERVDPSEVGGFGLYQEIILAPAANLANLDEVFVVLGKRS